MSSPRSVHWQVWQEGCCACQSDGKQQRSPPSSSQRSRHRCGRRRAAIATERSRLARAPSCAAAAHHCLPWGGLPAPRAPRGPPRRSEESSYDTKRGLSGRLAGGQPTSGNFAQRPRTTAFAGAEDARLRLWACGPRKSCSGPSARRGTAAAAQPRAHEPRGGQPGQPPRARPSRAAFVS